MVSVDYRTSHGGLENTITLLLKEKYIFGWGLEPPITIACIRPCTYYCQSKKKSLN
jgi:hypothetical protein